MSIFLWNMHRLSQTHPLHQWKILGKELFMEIIILCNVLEIISRGIRHTWTINGDMNHLSHTIRQNSI